MKVLIIGANGQLGKSLQATCPEGIAVTALDLPEFDLADPAAAERCIAEESPQAVINASAYTAVDKAESDEAAADAVNHLGVAHLARAAAGNNVRLVHVSTDYVFDGTASSPYRPEDAANPAGVYGRTKLAGENAVREACGGRELIVRTAWLYSPFGANFVKTMLRLMNERPEVGVVADQIGTPTSAFSLARVIWKLLANRAGGTVHWSDAGAASWYDFAVAIREEGEALGLLPAGAARVRPIATRDYPTPARRPAYSVLDKSRALELSGVTIDHWRVELRRVLARLAELS